MNKYTDVENCVVILYMLGSCSHHRHLSICPTVTKGCIPVYKAISVKVPVARK